MDLGDGKVLGGVGLVSSPTQVALLLGRGGDDVVVPVEGLGGLLHVPPQDLALGDRHGLDRRRGATGAALLVVILFLVVIGATLVVVIGAAALLFLVVVVAIGGHPELLPPDRPPGAAHPGQALVEGVRRHGRGDAGRDRGQFGPAAGGSSLGGVAVLFIFVFIIVVVIVVGAGDALIVVIIIVVVTAAAGVVAPRRLEGRGAGHGPHLGRRVAGGGGVRVGSARFIHGGIGDGGGEPSVVVVVVAGVHDDARILSSTRWADI